MKIGHGPATVNGRRASDGASGCESGNLPGLVEAGTLREKECGDWPRYSREAFLLLGGIDWGAGGDHGNFSARGVFA